MFNQVPLTLNQEYQSFLKGCGSAFAGYSGEGNKIRAVTRDGVFFGLFAEKHNAEGVVFRTVLKDGLSFEDGNVKGTVILPEGLTGVFRWKGRDTHLSFGSNAVSCLQK